MPDGMSNRRLAAFEWWWPGDYVVRVFVIAGLMIAALAAGPVASQQSPQHDRRGERMGPPNGRPMLPAREASFGGRSAPGSQGAGSQAGGSPSMERMTPEERRQLRQDIHQHGRDVYRTRQDADKQ
jgi:hypothetical protein